MKHTLRENLLVTFGARAAVMDALGHITLPTGSRGEDALANLAVEICDAWIARDDEDPCLGFDEFIETALIRAFANPRPKEWFGIVRWHEDDIRAALIDNGYIPDRESIDLIRLKMENHGFTELQIAAGWDMIHQYIADESENLNREEVTEA